MAIKPTENRNPARSSAAHGASGQTAAREIGSLDIAKFALSIVIVAIHSGIGGNWETAFIYPWARLAVPIFFIITAFLFFKKYNQADEAGKSARLRKFVKRNAQLYLFWLIVLLIPTLYLRNYFGHGIIRAIVDIVDGVFFGSTFVASWYIAASVIAVVAIVFLSKHMSNRMLLILCAVFYVFACLASNYGNMTLWNGASTADLLEKIAAWGLPSLACPYNNFVVALLWVMIGKIIADHEASLERFYRSHAVSTYLLLAISLAVLFLEQYAIRLFDTAYANDCYLALPFSATLIMIILLNVPASIKHGKELRAASIITYCLHATLTRSMFAMSALWGFSAPEGLVFLIAISICWLATFAILKLEKVRFLKFLRYAH